MEAAYTSGGKEAGAALLCLAEKGCANAKSEKFCQFFCHFRCEMLVVYCSGPTLPVSNVSRNSSNFCFFFFFFGGLSLTRVARYPCHQPLIWFMAVELSRSEGENQIHSTCTRTTIERIEVPWTSPLLRFHHAAKQLFSGVTGGAQKVQSLRGRPCLFSLFSSIFQGMNLTCLIYAFACSVIFHSPLRSFRG